MCVHTHVIEVTHCDSHASTRSCFAPAPRPPRWKPFVAPVPRAWAEAEQSGVDAAPEQLPKRFEHAIKHSLYNVTGLDFVWSHEPNAERASVFIICWAYARRSIIAVWKVMRHGALRVEPPCNSPTEMLTDCMKAILWTQPSPTDVATITVYCAELRWDQTQHPVVEAETMRGCSVQP